MQEHDLRAVDREGRDHHGAAALRGADDRVGEPLGEVGVGVAGVAVGRLHHERVGGRWWLGRGEQRVLLASEVAAEHHGRAARDPYHHARCAEDVPGGAQLHLDAVGHPVRAPEPDAPEAVERPDGVLLGVEGERGAVLREAGAVGEVGVLLLEVAAVLEDDRGEGGRPVARVDRAVEPVAHERGDVPAVVEVGVAEDDRVDGGRVERQGRPVAQPQLLRALEQPAVEEHACGVGLEEELAAGHGAGPTEERECRAQRVTIRRMSRRATAGSRGTGP